MTTFDIFNVTDKKVTSKKPVSSLIFEVDEINHNLLRDSYQAYLSNGRTNNAVTKTRGLVSGGGKKPWRQKGTGRARFGSTRNPIWTGGGIAFGPTGLENYTRKVNLKSKRIAITHALTSKANEKQVKIVSSLDMSSPKTKDLMNVMTSLELSEKRTLLVVKNKQDNLILASRNIANIKIVNYNYLNVFDVLNADMVVIENDCLELIEKWLLPNKEVK